MGYNNNNNNNGSVFIQGCKNNDGEDHLTKIFISSFSQVKVVHASDGGETEDCHQLRDCALHGRLRADSSPAG